MRSFFGGNSADEAARYGLFCVRSPQARISAMLWHDVGFPAIACARSVRRANNCTIRQAQGAAGSHGENAGSRRPAGELVP